MRWILTISLMLSTSSRLTNLQLWSSIRHRLSRSCSIVTLLNEYFVGLIFVVGSIFVLYPIIRLMVTSYLSLWHRFRLHWMRYFLQSSYYCLFSSLRYWFQCERTGDLSFVWTPLDGSHLMFWKNTGCSALSAPEGPLVG